MAQQDMIADIASKRAVFDHEADQIGVMAKGLNEMTNILSIKKLQ
jgi:hypothetical protein